MKAFRDPRLPTFQVNLLVLINLLREPQSSCYRRLSLCKLRGYIGRCPDRVAHLSNPAAASRESVWVSKVAVGVAVPAKELQRAVANQVAPSFHHIGAGQSAASLIASHGRWQVDPHKSRFGKRSVKV